MKDFLLRIRPSGLLNLVAIAPEGGGIVGATFEMPAEVDDAEAWALQKNAAQNVYFTVNPVREVISKKPARKDILRCDRVWVDIDPDPAAIRHMDHAEYVRLPQEQKIEAYKSARNALLTETVMELCKDSNPILVNSGNGLGAFWTLDEALSIEECESLNRRLVERFGGDPSAVNADRLMRLPDTRNYPSTSKINRGYPTEPSRASVLAPGGDVYRAKDFAEWLPPVGTQASKEVRTHNAPQILVAEVQKIIDHISSEEYDDWIRVGMGLYHHFGGSDEGREIWDQWSMASDKYPGRQEIGYKWDSFGRQEGNVLTFATVCAMAKEAGADLGNIHRDNLARLAFSNTDDEQLVALLMQNPTEDAMAAAFTRAFRGKYVYIHGGRGWHRWDGTRWNYDGTGTVLEEIRSMARQYNPDRRPTLAKSSFYKAVATICQTSPAFARSVTDFDNDNYLLNTPAGTVDLRTGQMRQHDPADCITLSTNVSPTRQGGAVFRKFLKEITVEDSGLINFHQCSLGAALSGAIEEHWLLFWIGNGRNGKNTLGEAVTDAMGDYSRKIPASTLMSKKHAGHPTSLMTLKGVRLATSSEVEEGAYLAEATINELTGDKEITARYTHCDEVTFTRTQKHVIYGNYRPRLSSANVGIISRIRMVPFEASFLGREDPDLPQKLQAELGYILQWLIDGHAAWMAAGKKIGTCKAVEDESQDYVEVQSTPETWLRECCDEVDDDPSVKVKDWPSAAMLFRSYSDWKIARGEAPPSQHRLSEWLKKRFRKIKSKDCYRYAGLQLKNPLACPQATEGLEEAEDGVAIEIR